MKPLRNLLIGLLLVAAAVTPVVLYRIGQPPWHRKSDLLRERNLDIERLEIDNGVLSNIVARHQRSGSLSRQDLSELLRLRNEAGQLRLVLGETNRLGNEIAQLRSGLDEVRAEKAKYDSRPVALTDGAELELRQARVERLQQWLARHSEQAIPELRFVSNSDWLGSVKWTAVSDDEFAGWARNFRQIGEFRFSNLATDALKKYAAANNGAFPADLNQLKPYFMTPIEDAILQRWEIVPSRSLPAAFVEDGPPEWADKSYWTITEKAPVDGQHDVRIAITTNGSWGGGGGVYWPHGP